MSIGVGSWTLPLPPDPPPPPPLLGGPSLDGAAAVPDPPPGGAGMLREPMCDAPLDRLCDGYDGGGLSAEINTMQRNVSE